MQHHARNIGGLAQSGVAHDVDVRKSGNAKRVAQAGTTRAFEVEKELQILGDPETGIEGFDARGCVFLIRAQAVRTAVFRGE